ncbi:MAG: substrate-binding domain-containing protein [Chloroflexota bacterium]|nr:substrate-binding domain-containing protein [Chloroflexota bacterium]
MPETITSRRAPYIKEAASTGLRIPHDIAIVGFGDFRMSAYLAPALTTITLPTSLVVRDSA